jgi:hypothetical protein
LSFGQHALVEDARYQNTLGFNPVKHNMASVFHAAQAMPDVIAGAAYLRLIHELPATCFKGINIADGLILAPGT